METTNFSDVKAAMRKLLRLYNTLKEVNITDITKASLLLGIYLSI